MQCLEVFGHLIKDLMPFFSSNTLAQVIISAGNCIFMWAIQIESSMYF